MRNPLNDAETFAAICAGAGFAFGVSACMTLGQPSMSDDFATPSVISLVVSALLYIGIRATRKMHTKKSSPSMRTKTEPEESTNQMDCNPIISAILPNVKKG